MVLKEKTTIELTPTSPFAFDSTFFKPDHFTTDDHIYKPGVRWQTMDLNGTQLGLKYQDSSRPRHPGVTVSVFSRKKLSSEFLVLLRSEIIYRYNLDLDLKGFYLEMKQHPELQPAIRNLYGMRPGQPSSLYEYLIIGIILQNAAVRRSIQMFRNLLSQYGTSLEFDGKTLLCLWHKGRFINTPEQELRDLKIGYRAKSILRTDAEFSRGQSDEMEMRNWDTEAQKKKLLSLYGVGPATVWYLLFDVFHHWDVFEHISPWEQKLYARIFFQKESASIEAELEFINSFGKYKHLAVHYLWENIWWKRYNGKKIAWLEKEIRI